MAGLEVTWKKMGPEFTYTVMFSKSADGPWIPAHQYRITDDVVDWIINYLEESEEYSGSSPYTITDNNVFVINDLRNDEQYFIKVLSHDKYHLWWYSYNGKGSLEGGLASDTMPSPTDGNAVGFQFEVI